MRDSIIRIQGQNDTAAQASRLWNIIYGVIFGLAYACCLMLSIFPEYRSYLALTFLLCAMASFFTDRFYLYLPLFMYVRYRMFISILPAFEVYACLMILKFILDHRNIKLRTSYFPAFAVMLLHTLFAATRVDLLTALKLALYLIVVYITLSKVLHDDSLMRKFLFVFMLGAIVSGIYGYTSPDTVTDFRVAGAGVYEVKRNYGILYDPNFACLFYIAAIYIALFLKGLPKIVNFALAIFFTILLLETTSLSGMITFCLTAVLALVLKYRTKSLFIILGLAAAAALFLSIPQVQQIEAIAGLIVRIKERLLYIQLGRWDFITTGRTDLWTHALALFNSKSLIGKLFGGSVVTVNLTDANIFGLFNACHQSVIQGILDFGIIGTLVIFLSFGSVLFYRIIRHLFRASNYHNEDIKIIQILLAFEFFCISMTIDTFVDWASMLFFFV